MTDVMRFIVEVEVLDEGYVLGIPSVPGGRRRLALNDAMLAQKAGLCVADALARVRAQMAQQASSPLRAIIDQLRGNPEPIVRAALNKAVMSGQITDEIEKLVLAELFPAPPAAEPETDKASVHQDDSPVVFNRAEFLSTLPGMPRASVEEILTTAVQAGNIPAEDVKGILAELFPPPRAVSGPRVKPLEEAAWDATSAVRTIRPVPAQRLLEIIAGVAAAHQPGPKIAAFVETIGKLPGAPSREAIEAAVRGEVVQLAEETPPAPEAAPPAAEPEGEPAPATLKPLSAEDGKRVDAVCEAVASGKVKMSSDPENPGFYSSALVSAGLFEDLSRASGFLSRAFAAGEVGRGSRDKTGFRYYVKRAAPVRPPPPPPPPVEAKGAEPSPFEVHEEKLGPEQVDSFLPNGGNGKVTITGQDGVTEEVSSLTKGAAPPAPPRPPAPPTPPAAPAAAEPEAPF